MIRLTDDEIDRLCRDLEAHNFEDAVAVNRQLQADIDSREEAARRNFNQQLAHTSSQSTLLIGD